MIRATVVIENASLAFDREYSYIVPVSMHPSALPGCRVRVPFGKGNQKRTGLILSLSDELTDTPLKPLLAVLDAAPLLNEEGLFLLRYLQQTTFCTWFDALRLLIPSGLALLSSTVYSLAEDAPLSSPAASPRQQQILQYLSGQKRPVDQATLCEVFSTTAADADIAAVVAMGAVKKEDRLRRKIQDDKVVMVRLAPDWPPIPLTPKQKLVFSFLQDNAAASIKEIAYYTGTTRAVIAALEKKGAVEFFEELRWRNPYDHVEDSAADAPAAAPALSPEQQAVFEQLLAHAQSPSPRPALLYGVTGSGKTQVFLRLIAQTLAGGRGAIVMVPEIALTAQTLDEFHRWFGRRVAVLHSGLSLGERMDEWRRIREGEATVVVGTRSAVFAPLARIGLIVMDEEQEHTYKSEKSPRFHARDVAATRCKQQGGMLLLCSATPSVESYHYAQTDSYFGVALARRFGDAPLPAVTVVDMKDPDNLSASPSLSGILLEELRYNLEHQEQSILLLNRRGYSTVVKCSQCGAAAECPNCSVSLTFHAANQSLVCHYCGFVQKKVRDNCPHCASEFVRYAGAGTQKLEEDLTRLFPDARILRMDMDTTMSRGAHEKKFADFLAQEYDIMIGTQMVSKGLNFPRVTLVGVLCADHSLYAGDFRSYERTFSLLTQVVGRSGRGEFPGRAYVQTYSPDHPIIALASMQDYPAFWAQEIQSRQLHLYPPYSALAGIGFTGEQQAEVQKWAQKFLAQFRKIASERYSALPLRLLGPVPCDVLRVAGKYRYKLLLKCKMNRATRALLWEMLRWFYGECKTVSAFIDPHYDYM